MLPKLLFAFVAIPSTALFLHMLTTYATGVPLGAYPGYFGKSNPVCGKWGGREGFEINVRTASALQDLLGKSKIVQSDPGFDLWQTPLWSFWTPKGMQPGNAVFVVAQWAEPGYGGAPIQPGAHILDGGGFVGDYAKFALNNGAAKVYVAEPSRSAIECIRRNLASELASGKAVLYPKGLWDRDDQLFLEHQVTDNPAAHRVNESQREGKQGEWVPLVAIDRMVEELGIVRLDILKLDIEGAETKAIHGAKKTIARFHPVIAIGTEHTDDILQNNRNVIAAMKAVAPDYEVRCGYSVVKNDQMVPETLFFYPAR